MRRRLTQSQRLFQIAVIALVLSALGAIRAWGLDATRAVQAAAVAAVGSAVVAIAARIWQAVLEQARRRVNFTAGLGGYGLDQLRDPRFLAR